MTAFDRNAPSLEALALPVKDLARGVRTALAQSRRLGPVWAALPEPMRGLVSDIEGLAVSARAAVGRIRPGGRAADRPNSLPAIEAARDPALRFAKAAEDGLTQALRRMGRDDLMVSATLAALAYRSAAPERAQAQPEAAARLALALMNHHVAGVAPGTTIGTGPEETRLIRLAGFATMLWMTVPRETPREHEEGLLGLCIDVALSIEAEIAAAGTDPARLAALLATYADVV